MTSGPDRSPNPGSSAVMPPAARQMMAGRAYRTLTRWIILPWVLQGTKPAGRALDIGAGTGVAAAAILQRRRMLEMTLVDYDPEMVAVLRRTLTRFGERAQVARADACALPFQDGTFDLVLSMAMLHHVADPEAALSEAMRVLKPGGRLVGYDMLPGAPMHRAHVKDRMIRPDALARTLSQHSSNVRIKVAPARAAVRFTALKPESEE